MPYLAGRIANAPFKPENLSRPAVDYLKLFYFDTAVQGNTANLMCANAFCGTGRQVFGTDFPMASADLVKETIASIQRMTVADADKQAILDSNARRLLKLE